MHDNLDVYNSPLSACELVWDVGTSWSSICFIFAAFCQNDIFLDITCPATTRMSGAMAARWFSAPKVVGSSPALFVQRA